MLNAAIDDGLEIEKFNSRDDVINSFGGCDEEIPASYWENIKKIGYPCVHVYDNGGIDYWESAEKFNAEQAAREFLLSDYEAIIEIETITDARYYSEKYDGNQRGVVRRLAREILGEMKNEKNHR
jgi:hypothetical protein